MSRHCAVCGKGARSGNLISHSNIKTRRRWLPNLQRVRIMVGNSPKRAYVCTGCLRSGKVKRAF